MAGMALPDEVSLLLSPSGKQVTGARDAHLQILSKMGFFGASGLCFWQRY